MALVKPASFLADLKRRGMTVHGDGLMAGSCALEALPTPVALALLGSGTKILLGWLCRHKSRG